MKTITRPTLLPDAQIKAAILHPEEEVRLTALEYFTSCFSQDPTIMPLVIQAVEQFGHDSAFSLLRDADSLVQTNETFDWLVKELKRPYDTSNVDEENYHYAIALIVEQADPDLLAKRQEEIVPLLPEPVRQHTLERLELTALTWDERWQVLLSWGRTTMKRDSVTIEEDRQGRRIVDALARHADDQARSFVLSMLQRQCKRDIRPLMEWLEPSLVALAGQLKLEKALPHLLRCLDEGYESVVDRVGIALRSIGTDKVVQAINYVWPKADSETKLTFCEALEGIHRELAAERVRVFLEKEEDPDVAIWLGRCILSQFDSSGIESVRQLVLGDEDDIDNEQRDLRFQLVNTAAIMNASFPEYFKWHQDVMADKYGWGGHRSFRLSKTLRGIFDDAKDSPATSNTYQLKITLDDIKPPIWRRVIVADCSLSKLHELIQIVMGWENAHLYEFEIDRKTYTEMNDFEDNMITEDSGSIHLSEVIHKAKQKFIYRYDFGDDWLHQIRVEAIGEIEPDKTYPMCLDGKRACPPEDVGGTWGYEEFLKAVMDPNHEEHQEMLEWCGEYDPEALDLEEINRDLASLVQSM